MTTPHLHFCSDCDKDYECRITEPCHLYDAEFCLDDYLKRQRAADGRAPSEKQGGTHHGVDIGKAA